MKLEPGMAYNTKTLNKVFAFLSVLFLLAVFWLLFDDYVRPWKGFQVKSWAIKKEILSKEIANADKDIDLKKLDEINKQIDDANMVVGSRKDEIAKIKEKLAHLGGVLHAENMTNGEYNALVAEYTFKAEMAAEHHDHNAKELKKSLDQFKEKFAESKDRLKKLQQDEKDLRAQLLEQKKELVQARKDKDSLVGAKERLVAAKNLVTPNVITFLRNLPMTDYLDPTLKIQQVVLDNITDDRYFQHVPKVDRCMTCHVFIDQPGYEEQEHPFKTHPNLELMVGANSDHPMKKFGCTTCHGGEGHRVRDFSAPAHTPEDEYQKAEWVEKYHYHPPHKVAQPMFKTKHTESQCLKCHEGVRRVPEAKNLNEGIQLVETFGCYACHKIDGWDELPKPGPSLEKISSKIDKNFAKNWVWNPRFVNKKAKMPHFFNQTNNSKPEFRVKNVAEVNAMVEYLWEISEDYRPYIHYKNGDEERGKELISKVGCLGCHQVEGVDEEFQRAQNRRGPYLVNLGSKVDSDWLVSWIQKPSHYQSDTIMPSFRLDDQEARDIASFLLSQKNKSLERMKFDPLDKKVRDELLIDYFTAFDTLKRAEAKLSNLSDHERTMELGKRSIGKYGCYSCHNIKGFEGRSPIGPELSAVGSKPITQFGFGHEHIPHERDAWFTHHLENPRSWDNGVEKAFKDLQRMPRYNFTKDEIEKMTIFLLGLVSEKIPVEGKRNLSSAEVVQQKGMNVILDKNCMGCHKIDGQGGEITKNYVDDLNEGPPFLVTEGHRVQADWLHQFLGNVYPLRPWLGIRMPSFNLSNQEKNDIVSYFQSKANQVVFETAHNEITWEPGEKKAAIKLFNSLACATCHTTGLNSDEASAPNLFMAKGRLRMSWIQEWISAPPKILPYTSMPNFWEGGESQEPGVLGGDPKKQTQALTKYVIEMYGRPPADVRKELRLNNEEG